MSYTVYIILITVLHVIYFTVQMGLDLFKDVNAKHKSGVETFDVSAMESETPTVIAEVSQDGAYLFKNEPNKNEPHPEDKEREEIIIHKEESSEAEEPSEKVEVKRTKAQKVLFNKLKNNEKDCLAVEPKYQQMVSMLDLDDLWTSQNSSGSRIDIVQNKIY